MASITEISQLIDVGNSKLILSINDVKKDLKHDIQQLSTHINGKLNIIDQDIKKLQQRCDVLEDLVMRLDRRKELMVRNVPVLKDENVATIAGQICQAIGFLSPYGVPVAFRFGTSGAIQQAEATKSRVLRSTSSTSDKREDKSIPSPPILFKFATEWDTRAFMVRYFHHSQLKLTDIGFKTTDRIYVNQNLTAANFAIFRLGRELKKAGVLSKVRVSDGVVAVQKIGNSKVFTMVTDIQDLLEMKANSSD